MTQRAKMKELHQRSSGDDEATIRAYAKAEEGGKVERKRNSHNWDSTRYARALLRDGKRNGWLQKP